MKINEMKLDDLLYMNLHILSKKLFNTIDYKIAETSEFYRGKKVKVGYERKGVGVISVYEVQYNKISKAEYYKLKKTDAHVKVIVTENIRTYKDEYNYILNSKIKDKEKALKNLYNDFYNLADEYITELEKYKSFLSEDYLNRVKSNLKPTMEHYITKILNAKTLTSDNYCYTINT